MKIKSYFVKIKDNIAKIYNKNKKLFISVLLLCVLLFGYCAFLMSSKEKSNNTIESKNETKLSASNYEDMLELKIKNMLLEIDEVKSAGVMVVCDGSEVNHYLKDNSSTNTTSENSTSQTITEETVYEKSGSNSVPVLEYTIFPKVIGVMVVVNKISPSTKLTIINSISVVLNIDASCISIILD